MELDTPGARGMIPSRPEPAVAESAKRALAAVPSSLRRKSPPQLPAIPQPQVYRHFLRLSQETMGAAVSIDIGNGTATMKYNPPANEAYLNQAGFGDFHPLTDDESMQGLLTIMYRLEHILRELSGLARFSLQPGGGTQGMFANALIMRAYHASRGDHQRDEIVTTLLSHPGNAAAPAQAGYRVVTVYPGPRGYAELDAVKAVLSERTAGLFISNPEDTGIFNPDIDKIVRAVHDAGGLCAHDMANANGLITISRTVDAGFDLCQFNLHKTFSGPHASGGPASAPIGASAALERFLPVPLVEHVDGRYRLVFDRPESVGRVRSFLGGIGTVLRAYLWSAALGGDGLRDVAEAAVLNNVYLAHRVEQLSGIRPSFADTNTSPRLEQVRYTLAPLAAETGLGTEDISRRTGDYGVSGYFPSHHPWYVPEPMSLEPTETPTRADLDTYAEILGAVVAEARADPDFVRRSPYNGPIHLTDPSGLDDPDRWALTWRAHLRKNAKPAATVE